MVTPSLSNGPDPDRPAAIAQKVALSALYALIFLQPLWHGWLAPPRIGAPAVAAAIATLPWLLVLIATFRDPSRGVLWGGTLALFYFSHGVAVAWGSSGTERLLALTEIVLTLLVIVPPGAVAWRARREARASAR